MTEVSEPMTAAEVRRLLDATDPTDIGTEARLIRFADAALARIAELEKVLAQISRSHDAHKDAVAAVQHYAATHGGLTVTAGEDAPAEWHAVLAAGAFADRAIDAARSALEASAVPTCSVCGVPIAEHPLTDACGLHDEASAVPSEGEDADFERMLAGYDRIINDKALQRELLDAGLLVRVDPASAVPEPTDRAHDHDDPENTGRVGCPGCDDRMGTNFYADRRASAVPEPTDLRERRPVWHTAAPGPCEACGAVHDNPGVFTILQRNERRRWLAATPPGPHSDTTERAKQMASEMFEAGLRATGGE